MATVALRDATERPTPITDEPRYSGCATHRYGPDKVTSRALCRCPADQNRIASPTLAIVNPAINVALVGRENQRTRPPHTNPSGTRRRASALATQARLRASTSPRRPPSRAGRSPIEPPFHRANDLVSPDVEETHALQPATPHVMALADFRS